MKGYPPPPSKTQNFGDHFNLAILFKTLNSGANISSTLNIVDLQYGGRGGGGPKFFLPPPPYTFKWNSPYSFPHTNKDIYGPKAMPTY